MSIHHKKDTVSLQPPDEDGPIEIDVWVTWKMISKKIPAKMYGPNAGPEEPAEWEVEKIEIA